MKKAFWRWLIRNHPQQLVLPWYYTMVFKLLFPVIGMDKAYDVRTGIWTIFGETYDGEFFQDISNLKEDAMIVVHRKDGEIIYTEVNNTTNEVE